MKTETSTFMPNSNKIHGRHDENGMREDYFAQILCTKDGQNHNVSVGDICMIRGDEGVKTAPWKKETTVIGQVLALFVKRESVDQSTYHVKVRRLARWKEELSSFATKKSSTDFAKNCAFRPNQALCETLKVETHSLANVLRTDIQILDSDSFITTDKLPIEFDSATESYTMSLCCPARIDENNKFHDARADWNQYDLRRSEKGRRPPSALTRGWELLEDNPLLQALTKEWQVRSTHFFGTEKTATGKENEKKDDQSSRKSSAKKSKRKRGSTRSVSFAAGSKPGRSSKKSIKVDTSVSHCSADSVTAQDSTTVDETLTEASNDAFVEETQTPASLRPVPLHKPVFQTHKKSKISTTYVEAVEMKADKAALAPKLARRKRKEQRWQFRVGDILIVRCAETHPPKTSFVAKESKWFPFRVPWSVVQVVAIYHRDNDEEMKMQIRWFYRPDELNENVQEHLTREQKEEFEAGDYQSRVLVEVDEHINEVPVESALGHAKVTSESCPSELWWQPNLEGAVPEIGFVCRHMHIVKDDDPILYPVDDWTNYGVSSGPLYRGLHCPKCRPGQNAKLRERYEERLCDRLGIEQLTESNVLEAQKIEDTPVLEWSPEEMVRGEGSCSSTHYCYGNKQNDFFSCASVQVFKERFDARGMAKKSENQELQFSIGDFVCITCSLDKADRQIDGKEGKNPWFPFRGPYLFVQVLNIYRQSAKRTSPVLLEVRHFYRRGEIKHVSAKHLPSDCARDNEEEVFESFDVETILAGRVLGLADVFLGYHNEKFSTKATNATANTSGLFRPKCRCAFYKTKVGVQQLFCADSTVLKWSRRILERGLRASKMIRGDKELAKVIEFGLGISISAAQVEKNSLFQSLIEETKKIPLASPLFTKTVESVETSFYSQVSIGIQWANYTDQNHLCSQRDRSDCWWKICVGGVVAVRTEGFASNPYYNSNWEPAQVLAITSGGGDDSTRSTYRFHVRQLRRSGNAALINSFPGRLCESDCNSVGKVSSDDLLGPVYVASEEGISSVWRSAVPYLPTNVMTYENDNDIDLTLFTWKAVHQSGLYNGDEMRLLFNALDEELPGFSKQNLISPEEISIEPSQPALIEPTALGQMYTDANGTQYYRRVKTEPSIEDFAELIRGTRQRIDGPWTVELGDVVAVRYADGCGGAQFAIYDSPHQRTKNWPAKCPWAVCEVVAILVQEEALENNTRQRVELEVRWYYRAPEIKGSSRFIQHSSENCCEEIFESDHYDIISAQTLFFPVKIHDKATPLGKPRFLRSLPVVEFFSCRLWSAHRESLLPVESSELARMKRARQYSPIFQHDAGLRESMDVALGLTEGSSVTRNDWRSSFLDVIQKLSLTDASKEGFKSSKAIVGRDKEMNHILGFLRTALGGSSKEGHRSLFIAGPPGVGKTACVRAAMSELEQLRAKGQVPPFDFLSMNGMEMRDPFEAYVQLWEKISGRTVIPEHAAAKLEACFTKDQSGAAKEAKRSVGSVVVLLDEIDYLVTKNQSVLYNFFDWPTHNQQRRLIVLGVSNTLNLAEQLHTRVQSRIGARRCIFKAYDATQIEKILRAKLLQASPGCTVFDEDAIVFVSKKTASLSGDIRRAFQICRTAAEYVMRERGNSTEDPLVTIGDALKVSRESFYSAKSQAITRCSPFEALLLVTLASLSKSTGREFGGFDMEEILVKMEALANGLGDERYLPTPTLSEAMGVVIRLAEGNIVSVVTPKSTSLTYRASLAGSGGPWPLVSLTVDDLSVLLALKKSPHKDLGLKYLGLSGF